jgi:hypothetical protein
MSRVYVILAAIHITSVVVSGILWTIFVLRPTPGLRREFRDIRAVHFGSLYLVPWFLGLTYVFERLNVPAWHQAAFPIGLGLLVLLSGIGYVLPRETDLDPFYFWTRGWPMVLSLAGLACLIIALCWTAGVLIVYALRHR